MRPSAPRATWRTSSAGLSAAVLAGPTPRLRSSLGARGRLERRRKAVEAHVLRPRRPGEIEALRIGAAELADLVELVLGLDPLRNGGHSHLVGERDHGRDDRPVLG